MSTNMDAFAETHARKSDPEVSKKAAAAAKQFYKSQCGKIYAALVLHGPQIADELAQHTGLSNVQVDRRLPDLLAMGLAKPTGQEGLSDAMRPCRIWMATPGGAVTLAT